MRAAKTTCLFMIVIIFLFIESSWGNETIKIEDLGIDILFPNNYTIIPSSQWKSDLEFGQQFIMKNPFDYDFLVQKKTKKGNHTFSPEASFFLIKSKHTRKITDKEFQYYVNKYYLNWEAAIKEKQNKGLLSNLLKLKVIQLPIVDYQRKTVNFKASTELGKIKELRFMYSAFFSSGNLVILFTPTSKSDEADFEFVITNISKNE